ncbi:hypothetical protein EC845_2904 [Comamonas sp. BIGb0124]|jgi:hypothetical protein|uniref:phosphatase domain-containing protein n=1 Tax=Comamonas sp. BIGb0124 TaxID=2485130 RepID=UPI000F497423|nr:polynucleotide kinase [Comamonas sp. BIGb0124]ROR21035.1 hypothetical protein EC845_2904 [Comamonas sp. BIGb0124]
MTALAATPALAPLSTHADPRAAVIVDVDGTLARFDPDREGRWVLGPEKNWPAFFDVMDGTPVFPDVARLVRLLHSQGQAILICSGRPAAWQAQTASWLQRHDIPFDAFYLRPEGADALPDEVVKEALYARMQADGFQPWLVLDDRDAVVAQWRSMGLTCLQCAPGAF